MTIMIYPAATQADLPGNAQADVCLADQCALVHCEYLSSWIEGHYIDGARTGPCRDRIMLERRQQCKVRALPLRTRDGRM